MNNSEIYDVALLGGGLAGLTAAILLAEAGHSIVLFEKHTYPFHKVCGEYVSRESLDFLKSLELDYDLDALPGINTFRLTTQFGTELTRSLDLGGIGISRYTLDNILRNRAQSLGASILDSTNIQSVTFDGDTHVAVTDRGQFFSQVVVGSFGKRSRLDKQLNRDFVQNPPSLESNYIGVKYHISTDFPRDVIELDIFDDGYCGVSAVDGEDRYCLCYLTTAKNLRDAQGDIKLMEASILSRNEHLYRYFNESTQLYDEPLAISQINFQPKSIVKDHILMAGDAARLVAPLSGNGMSMAMHGAALAARPIHDFLTNRISRKSMETEYRKQWKKHFGSRVRLNKLLQTFFFRQRLMDSSLKVLNFLPTLADGIIRGTHGRPFEKPYLQ